MEETMKLKTSLTIIAMIALQALLPGCATYDSAMEETAAKAMNAEERYQALKAVSLRDSHDAFRLQASVAYLALQSPTVPFIAESERLLDLAVAEDVDLSAATSENQAMVYLAALAHGSGDMYATTINSDVRDALSGICIPTDDLARTIQDIARLTELAYQYYVAKSCQALINDVLVVDGVLTTRDINMVLITGEENACTFSPQTNPALFISELIACRLEQHDIHLSKLLPTQQEVQQ